MQKVFFILGGVLGGLGVMAGAFGAHTLSRFLGAEDLELFETAARYQMYHALALLAVAWGLTRWPTSAGAFHLSGWAFAIGTLLFSGSLYAYAVTGSSWLPALTPLGGVSFAIGWLALVIGAWQA